MAHVLEMNHGVLDKSTGCEASWTEKPYMKPIEKMIHNAIFLVEVVRSRRMTGIGKAKMNMSVSILEQLM